MHTETTFRENKIPFEEFDLCIWPIGQTNKQIHNRILAEQKLSWNNKMTFHGVRLNKKIRSIVGLDWSRREQRLERYHCSLQLTPSVSKPKDNAFSFHQKYQK
jgi:hypothetical protein